ncbi:MAG: hypothetical protein AB1510_08385 [Bacillota bacterium]
MEKVLEQILEELKSLREGQEAQGQRLERLEKGQEALQKGQDELRQGQQDLQNQVTKMEVRIENEVIDKIRALFDARQVHLDYFESLRDAMTRVEDNIGFLMRREQNQEMRLEEHDREIRLLRLRK